MALRTKICQGAIFIIFMTTMIIGLFLQNKSPDNTPQAVVNNDLITDCVTRRVLGRRPTGLEVLPFSDPLDRSTETGEQRLASFQNIFTAKVWAGGPGGKSEVVSGGGSTLLYAQEVMAGLHTIISDIKQEFGISRVRMLDIPCGDMTWMSRFLKTRDDIDYTGIDIVPELIARHQQSFKNYPWKFHQHDIVEKPLNESFHLVLSRMMLQHLMTQDVITVLRRISDSGSNFLFTTTFSRYGVHVDLNREVKVRFRFLNLEIPPVSLVPPKCLMADGSLDSEHGKTHFLGLWKLPLEKNDLLGLLCPGSKRTEQRLWGHQSTKCSQGLSEF